MRAGPTVTPLLASAFLVVACSSAPLRSEGTVCSSDAECGAGLSCLSLGTFTDAGCTTQAQACSRPCTVDADCAPLGSRFVCFSSCGATRACGATH